jgi:hypothetical protein
MWMISVLKRFREHISTYNAKPRGDVVAESRPKHWQAWVKEGKIDSRWSLVKVRERSWCERKIAQWSGEERHEEPRRPRGF